MRRASVVGARSAGGYGRDAGGGLEADARPRAAFAAEAARRFAGRSRDGYFADGGALRRIWSEPAVMIAGMPRALLFMAAHPLFAAGVVEHSTYRQFPWRRLAGTISSFYNVVYGSRVAASAEAARVNALHARIDGALAAAAGPFSAGTAYSATDPRLLLWVWSAMVDTGLVMYETFVRRLDDEARGEFYADMTRVAELFGCPAASVPPTLSSFRHGLRLWLADDEISVGEDARAIAAVVLEPPLPLVLRPLNALVKAVAVGTLPGRIQEGYGRSTRGDRLAVAALGRCGSAFAFALASALLDTRKLVASQPRPALGGSW